MTGFEPRISGVGGNHSTNWATPLPYNFENFKIWRFSFLEWASSCLLKIIIPNTAEEIHKEYFLWWKS